MKEHVLIVDDSLTVRMDLGDEFRDAGFEVELCANLAEARDAIAKQAPALVILDVQLPDGDGIDFLVELRGEPSTERLPVFLLSTEAEVRDRVRGLRQGANEYIGKPYDASQVVLQATALFKSIGERVVQPPTILIIDDSSTYRQELGERVQAAGYRTSLAASGEEGLKLCSESRPDAVIVDGVMPGMEGTEVLRRIRSDPALYSTPCLLLTASGGQASEVLALDAGADAYVWKNEGLEVVLARLGAMLRSSRETRGRSAPPGGPGHKRILAVDDSSTYLEELSDQLRVDGYEVVQASSGEQALQLLKREAVDCILLDLRMPGLSGTETCKRVKGTLSLRNVPLIILTAHEEQDSMLEGINAGADDYVTKSADFEVLKARVRSQLRRKQFEDENRRVHEQILQKEAEARASRELAEARSVLLRRLEAKNAELEALSQELKTFAYSVSHDLRQPLRAMSGFSQALIEDYSRQLDETGKRYLARIQSGAERMGQLIDGLLNLSRVTRMELRRQGVDLQVLAQRVYERLLEGDPGRVVEFLNPVPLPATADPFLLESVLENLLGNAWKFTSGRTPARIELGSSLQGEEIVYFVRDNGAGFAMQYADKLFGPFQRLHTEQEFPGTGIGLATVQRILHRHHGRIWAESAPGQGATFFFTLPEPQEALG